MHVKERHCGDIQQLERLIRQENNAKQRDRYRIALLAIEGREKLEIVSKEVGENDHVVLVMDQAGWHTSPKLNVPENITLLFLPPYSPELNPIERLWAYLKSHYLSNRVYADYDALLAAGDAQVDLPHLMAHARK